LVSLIPRLLVKPLIGLGPVELDFDESIELEMTLRKIGRMIGRQAVKVSIKVSGHAMLLTRDDCEVGFCACPDNDSPNIPRHFSRLGIEVDCFDKHNDRSYTNAIRETKLAPY
jgi:hypothetical protein